MLTTSPLVLPDIKPLLHARLSLVLYLVHRILTYGESSPPFKILYEYSLRHKPKWIPKHHASREAKSRPQLRTARENDRHQVHGTY